MKNTLGFAALLTLTIATAGCREQGFEVDTFIDLNGDGIVDVRIEYDENGYYQLTDRNFDGKVDESMRYSLDHYLLSGTSDDDFDGMFETSIEFEHSLISVVLVDTNNNQIVDIVQKYKHGLIHSSNRYYFNEGSSMIGWVYYQFGYPAEPEVIEPSSMSEHQFQQAARRQTGDDIMENPQNE